MTTTDTRHILVEYRFDHETRRKWRELSDYSKRIEFWLKTNSLSRDQTFRYMLVGLYPDYRRNDDRNKNFKTSIGRLAEDPELDAGTRKSMADRYGLVNRYYGKEIDSSAEYLRLLTFDASDQATGECLFRFVVKGNADLIDVHRPSTLNRTDRESIDHLLFHLLNDYGDDELEYLAQRFDHLAVREREAIQHSLQAVTEKLWEHC